jgi:predicted nucleotide-binding protein
LQKAGRGNEQGNNLQPSQMAKQPSPPAERILTPAQMRLAIARFNRRITDLEAFDPTKVTDRRDPNITALAGSIGEALTETYGENTSAFRRYGAAAALDTAGYNMNGTRHSAVIEGLIRGKQRAIVLLEGAIRAFEEKLSYDESSQAATSAEVEPVSEELSREIFVVHGHDEAAKAQVVNVIERAGLIAVVLHEQPNEGKTIIEKFEKHGAAAGFAVIILTPDDVGGPSAEQLRPRARQNVIGEMFWFAGRLGRHRVCALVKGAPEMPSDFAGVGYTPFDEHNGWKTKLLQELDAAGYENLDWKKALA